MNMTMNQQQIDQKIFKRKKQKTPRNEFNI